MSPHLSSAQHRGVQAQQDLSFICVRIPMYPGTNVCQIARLFGAPCSYKQPFIYLQQESTAAGHGALRGKRARPKNASDALPSERRALIRTDCHCATAAAGGSSTWRLKSYCLRWADGVWGDGRWGLEVTHGSWRMNDRDGKWAVACGG